MKPIEIEEFACRPFDILDSQWMALTAQAGGKQGAMVCTWGGMGSLWGKSVVFVFVRPSRHTASILEEAEGFSLSVFREEDRERLVYLGRHSGRGEDKLAKAGLTAFWRQGVPCIEQAKLNIVCKTLYSQPLEGKYFRPDCREELTQRFDLQEDFHRLYVGEVLEILADETVRAGDVI